MVVYVGARRRARFIIRSCCFMSRLSATMVFAPPGQEPGDCSQLMGEEYQLILHGGAE